jgi:hypothetical protein
MGLETDLKPFIKINSKSITEPKYKGQSLKFVEDQRGENSVTVH